MNPLASNGGSLGRLVLGMLAGYLAGKGIIAADQQPEFIAALLNLYTASAAAFGFATMAWAWWKNRQHAKVAIAADAAGVDVPAVKATSLADVKASAAATVKP